jgi:hypothetical protein
MFSVPRLTPESPHLERYSTLQLNEVHSSTPYSLLPTPYSLLLRNDMFCNYLSGSDESRRTLKLVMLPDILADIFRKFTFKNSGDQLFHDFLYFLLYSNPYVPYNRIWNKESFPCYDFLYRRQI